MPRVELDLYIFRPATDKLPEAIVPLVSPDVKIDEADRRRAKRTRADLVTPFVFTEKTKVSDEFIKQVWERPPLKVDVSWGGRLRTVDVTPT